MSAVPAAPHFLYSANFSASVSEGFLVEQLNMSTTLPAPLVFRQFTNFPSQYSGHVVIIQPDNSTNIFINFTEVNTLNTSKVSISIGYEFYSPIFDPAIDSDYGGTLSTFLQPSSIAALVRSCYPHDTGAHSCSCPCNPQ